MMKRILYALAFVVLASNCKKEDDYMPTQFAYDITPVTLTEDAHVGAYYYRYKAADWGKKYTYQPELGEYDALQPDIMDRQREWARAGGVDFFIFNWNGNPDEDALLNTFASGSSSAVRMVINYNTTHLGATNTAPLSGAKLATMIEEFKGFASTHFSKDYYFKVDGQPVVLFSPLNMASNRAESIDFHTVIPALRQAMDEIGVNLYIVGEITSGWLPPQRYSKAIRAMDAISLSNWATENYDRSVFFPSFIDQNWKHWNDSTATWGVDFVPVIHPAYNDKVMNPASKIYDLGQSTAFFTAMSHVAKGNMGDKRLILINSWNNFQLGTSMEPTKEYGTTYLDLTRSQFKVGK
ncbi:glycoside hydrolase family 99-like domain-containing protein [Pontibacter amylolyticus]|uniref:Glycosyltransferase WbsX n=1 Tax=Pontibacter amylolyticus TaxID=1424080 RepID=A0ABQ1WF43_9BACT|nr:glycoside hydrolase family 99-like domain-containing protein [Pontibacter amylolyticus]GGG26084.1 hypothetical protein GCM10011323_32190 [Pontibacter amylolyticus]